MISPPSKKLRSRSAAPIPPTPSPRKPKLPPSSTPSKYFKGPELSPEDDSIKPEGNSELNHPDIKLERDEATDGTVTRKYRLKDHTRGRSLAPDYQGPDEEYIKLQIKLKIKREREEEEQELARLELEREQESRYFEREPTWVETGGTMELDDNEGREDQLNEREQSTSTLFREEGSDGGEGEIDYDDEPDDEERVGRDSSPALREEEEESDEKSDSDGDLGQSRKRTRQTNSLTSIRSEPKRKRVSRKEIMQRQKKREAEEQAELEAESSSFLDTLGIDPRPTLTSVKARITNQVAAKTSHFPAPHQVLAVKEPPTQYPRPPSPPRERREGGARRPTATLELPEFEDELVDYDEDQTPPEELISGKQKLEELEVVVEKPKQLETREEAIVRWKEETNISGGKARPIQDAYSWNSYRRTHQDLSSLSLNHTTNLPALLDLPRTLEAHQDLLNLRPPASHSPLIWSSIFDPNPPRIDSDSRQTRANWQLSNFRNGNDQALKKMVQEARDKDGIGKEGFIEVATQVFELSNEDVDKFELEKVGERNWLFAQQIVQLARIKNAYKRLAIRETIEAITSALETKTETFEAETRKIKLERDSLPKTIGNSQWILKLDRQVDELKVDHQETVEKIKRLEKNLRARLEESDLP